MAGDGIKPAGPKRPQLDGMVRPAQAVEAAVRTGTPMAGLPRPLPRKSPRDALPPGTLAPQAARREPSREAPCLTGKIRTFPYRCRSACRRDDRRDQELGLDPRLRSPEPEIPFKFLRALAEIYGVDVRDLV